MSHLPWLDADSINFPATHHALQDPNGLLAAGGNLSPRQLLEAYRRGIFPWYEQGQPVLWWTPNPRMVLYPEELHVSKSMEKLLRQKRFTITTNQAFRDVIIACAAPRADEAGTWITNDVINAYEELHTLGYAHSVEVWQDDVLVGGLYGIALGKVYFGESMFSLATNASKYGFIVLVQKLKQLDFGLIDCQVYSQHLASLGAIEIERREFESQLERYLPTELGPSIWPTNLSV